MSSVHYCGQTVPQSFARTCSIICRTLRCWLFNISSRWWIFSFMLATVFSRSWHLKFKKVIIRESLWGNFGILFFRSKFVIVNIQASISWVSFIQNKNQFVVTAPPSNLKVLTCSVEVHFPLSVLLDRPTLPHFLASCSANPGVPTDRTSSQWIDLPQRLKQPFRRWTVCKVRTILVPHRSWTLQSFRFTDAVYVCLAQCSPLLFSHHYRSPNMNQFDF